MKILLLSNKAPYPPKDGASIAIYNMAKGLAENNAEVHLLAVNTKKHYRPDNEVPEEFVQLTNYQSVFGDTDVNPVGALLNLLTPHSYFVSRFFFKEYAEALTKKLTETDFDVVQIEGIFMASYLPIIRKYSKAKVVLRPHNIEYIIWERYLEHSKKSLKNSYIKLHKNRLQKFEINTFKQVDAFIPFTEVDAEILKKIAPNTPRLSAITGIELAKYPHIKTVKEPNTIFYFGSMDWLPNIEAVEWFKENCWEEIKKKTAPDVKWIIAGINIPPHILAYEKDKRIKTVSDVPDAFEFYKQYNIQLAPILSGSGLRIKLVEGISYGKPIITSAIGMEGLFCENNKELLIADSPKEFIDSVVKIMQNEDGIQQQLSENARTYACDNFDNKLITKKIVDFYANL
ncbi:MAG: glycosyltransferase [Flavobacterium sp.]|nr:MAG: glycosyltransferase [Flavobacterium sp.]